MRSWQRSLILLLIFFLGAFSANACAQLRQIDPTKLPQDQRVQTVLSKVRPIEHMAHNWEEQWRYDTPKTQVASLLSSSLKDLRSVGNSASENEEFLLLTGIVAHLAYNLDVKKSYEVAVQSFERAQKLAPADYRPEWFLAAHRCQSSELKTGMEEMLGVESQRDWRELPVDFWDDYIHCSTLSFMPAHTLRAVDHATHHGESPSSYGSAVEIAKSRYQTTDASTTYPASDAWQATEQTAEVQFASEICGLGFSARGHWHIDNRDVTNGSCVSTIETGPYPSKAGQDTPTILILSRPPKPQEQLDDFVQSLIKKYPSPHSFTTPYCPSDKCVAFEIVTDTMYTSEGGAHMIVVGFAAQEPEFPGLLFEKPWALPTPIPKKPTHYRPDRRLHRLPGVIYTVVLLDSNASIFEKAMEDFRFVLQSVRLD